jgi:hypothetical protein
LQSFEAFFESGGSRMSPQRQGRSGTNGRKS